MAICYIAIEIEILSGILFHGHDHDPSIRNMYGLKKGKRQNQRKSQRKTIGKDYYHQPTKKICMGKDRLNEQCSKPLLVDDYI